MVTVILPLEYINSVFQYWQCLFWNPLMVTLTRIVLVALWTETHYSRVHSTCRCWLRLFWQVSAQHRLTAPESTTPVAAWHRVVNTHRNSTDWLSVHTIPVTITCRLPWLTLRPSRFQSVSLTPVDTALVNRTTDYTLSKSLRRLWLTVTQILVHNKLN